MTNEMVEQRGVGRINDGVRFLPMEDRQQKQRTVLGLEGNVIVVGVVYFSRWSYPCG